MYTPIYIYIYIYIYINAGAAGGRAETPGSRKIRLRAVTFIPIALPEIILQTSCCTHVFYAFVLQTVEGMGHGHECHSPG